MAVTATVCGVLLAPLTSCGSPPDTGTGHSQAKAKAGAEAADPGAVPAVGERLRSRIPRETRQVVAVYGRDKDSPDATVVLYTRASAKDGAGWKTAGTWAAHNGKKGWTTNHHENDKRTPVGVFTLSDAGGVLPDPGARLPYTRSVSFQAPHYWSRSHWHDFDYVIAIDYNRVTGTPPNDPTRPRGQKKGGSIWLHMDHGSGTSACVSLPKSAMRQLLRTLDPKQHPVVVMGDRARLRA